jgi:hypothetical protein
VVVQGGVNISLTIEVLGRVYFDFRRVAFMFCWDVFMWLYLALVLILADPSFDIIPDQVITPWVSANDLVVLVCPLPWSALPLWVDPASCIA